MQQHLLRSLDPDPDSAVALAWEPTALAKTTMKLFVNSG
uniref:Uncharacterized protein n=1 Tax=Peronospora matthiolae TaxID=2874970 RepID=A0AAV1U7B0_9STRA